MLRAYITPEDVIHSTVELTSVEVAFALKRILAVGATASVCFGVYAILFLVTFWSSYWHAGHQRSLPSLRIQWVVWVTGSLIMLRHVINIVGLGNICAWAQHFETNYHDPSLNQPELPVVRQCGDIGAFGNLNLSSVSMLINLYTPPLIALLSDGILAWRVFVAWDRSFWLKYILGLALTANFSVGMAVAVRRTHVSAELRSRLYVGDLENTNSNYWAVAYTAWAWMAFALNSTLSISILLRLRHVAGGHQGLGRYATLLKALVESAVLSWLASLGSAMIWSISLAQYYSLPDDVRAGHNSVVNSFEVLINGPLDWVSSVILIALPYLLGMSQALIIMRLNMFRLQSTQHLAEIITGPPDHLEVWTDMCLSLDCDSEAGRDVVDDHATLNYIDDLSAHTCSSSNSLRSLNTEKLRKHSDSTAGCSDCMHTESEGKSEMNT